jgi:hypothetical protein
METTTEIIFILLALTFMSGYILCSMAIISFLNKRSTKINYIFLRLMIIPYANRYKKLPRQEYGKTGNL